MVGEDGNHAGLAVRALSRAVDVAKPTNGMCDAVCSDQVSTYASPAHFDAPYGAIGAGGASSAVGIGARLPYSAPPVDVKTRDEWWRFAASSRFSVPDIDRTVVLRIRDRPRHLD
jgi:hypothetical protein